MENSVELILAAIKKALGDSADYFVIAHHETFDHNDDFTSISVSFAPRTDLKIEDCKIVGQSQSIQFDLWHDQDEPQMIVGEDTEIDITAKDIYASLYWGEVTKPIELLPG